MHFRRSGVTHHCYPQMDDAIVQKPVTEGPLRTHHVGIFLGRHALAILVRDLRPIHLAETGI